MKLYLAVALGLSIFGATPALAATFNGCDKFAVMMTTTPVPPQTPAGLAKLENVLQTKPRSADTILIGDSILERWPTVQQSRFGKTWNFSVGGDKTQFILHRLNSPDLAKVSAKQLVIMVGTNNLFDRDMSACSIADGVVAVVRRAQELWPTAKVSVYSILPRGPDFQQYGQLRINTNLLLQQHFAGTRVTFIQVDDAKMACGMIQRPPIVTNSNVCPQPDPYTCANYKPDNLHLEAGGYNQLVADFR